MAFREVICVLLALLVQESYGQLSECGRPAFNSRIVGGQAAPEGSWPWMASIHRTGGSHFCGGTLINNQWVLSAAHCFQGVTASSLTVFLGRQSQEGSNPNEVPSSVSSIIIHPDYNSVTSDNDIALLRLSSAVTFTNFIRPVCLAASNSTFFTNVDSWVTGWGTIGFGVPLPSPQDLMEVQVPIVGNRQCRCDYGVNGNINTVTENMICAGLRAGGKDSCQGDSGGPLVSKQSGVWVQSGVVSFGQGCAEPNFPGVYARVSQYQTWINSQISNNEPGFVTFRSTGTNSDNGVSCPSLGLPALTTVAPTPRPVVCGSAPLNSRIVGGSSVASPGVWPWMASLQMNGSHVCGGTLVAEDAVLSNADCFTSSQTPSDWTVILGRLRQNGSNPFEVTLNVTNITLSNLTGSNVAVLHLASKPTLNDYIQPICIDNGETFSVGTTCWAAGWNAGRGGVEEVLQEKQTTVMDCGNASTSSDSICTGVLELEQEDSGGPIMCKVGSSWFQAAVISATTNDNSTRARARARVRRERNSVTVFTRLSTFSSFLSSTLGAFLSPFSTASTTPSTSNATTAATTTSGSPALPFLSSLFHLLVLPVVLHLSL